ncbi:UPF0329 protein ECU05_1680/ECU11_0050-like [Homarus americanus]|uniref:UPF0329 protein ECU05_1680/ECU11_0050-like n=1 Tax=Homarus americanus TaxID=6706 RepID=UPI001C438C08|nr:UPF0329 protein ECU05_1680/ECU11_0050-like [Homarus americanus]
MVRNMLMRQLVQEECSRTLKTMMKRRLDLIEKNENNKEENRETEKKEEEKKEEEKKEKKVKKKKSFRSFSFLRREKKVAKVENTNGDVAKEEVRTSSSGWTGEAGKVLDCMHSERLVLSVCWRPTNQHDL